MTAAIGETFGSAGEGAAWGDAEAGGLGPEGEGIPQGPMDLGGGHAIQLDPAVIRALFREPAVVEAIKQRAQMVVDEANSMAVIPGAEYEYVYMDDGEGRPQCLVKPANYKAVLDTAAHSTLLMAAASVGSDPMIEAGGEPEGESGGGGMPTGASDAAAGGEAAAGEAADVALLAL